MSTTSLTRKRFNFTLDEIETLNKMATKEGTTIPAVLRDMLYSFVQNGSDYEPPMTESQSVIAPAGLFQAAQERARTEQGCRLRDVIAFEIRNAK